MTNVASLKRQSIEPKTEMSCDKSVVLPFEAEKSENKSVLLPLKAEQSKIKKCTEAKNSVFDSNGVSAELYKRRFIEPNTDSKNDPLVYTNARNRYKCKGGGNC